MLLHSVTLAVYLLLTSSSAQRTARSCVFSQLQPIGLRVNCSSLNLMELPRLPPETTELYVQHNQLTSVTAGHFDQLVKLNKVSLSPNPFRCDCSIQYLRDWLLQNRAVVSEEPLCSSPGSVAQKAILSLCDAYFSYCIFPRLRHMTASGCVYVSYNTAAAVMLGCIILLLFVEFETGQKIYFHPGRGREAFGIRGRLPALSEAQNRRRLHAGQVGFSADSDSLILPEDLERPLMNMELLPQVLETLHKKHNIKIKAT